MNRLSAARRVVIADFMRPDQCMQPFGHCNTLADFPAGRVSLLVYCSDCHRRPALNRDRVPANITILQLRARLVCSACGSRSTTPHIVWDGGGSSLFSRWGVAGIAD